MRSGFTIKPDSGDLLVRGSISQNVYACTHRPPREANMAMANVLRLCTNPAYDECASTFSESVAL